MRITQEADYALRIVLMLSRVGKNNHMDAKKISEKENVPLRFALKILRKLKKAEIVQSIRGVNGGYLINKDIENITMKDVIEAIDGSVFINRCLEDPNLCNLNRTDHCTIHKAIKKVQRKIDEELEGITFKQLIE